MVKIFGVLAILGAQREERILLLDILSLGEFAVAVAGLNLALKQLDVVALVEDAPFLLRLLELLILRNSGALLVQEHLNSRVCQVNQPMVKTKQIIYFCAHGFLCFYFPSTFHSLFLSFRVLEVYLIQTETTELKERRQE